MKQEVVIKAEGRGRGDVMALQKYVGCVRDVVQKSVAWWLA